MEAIFTQGTNKDALVIIMNISLIGLIVARSCMVCLLMREKDPFTLSLAILLLTAMFILELGICNGSLCYENTVEHYVVPTYKDAMNAYGTGRPSDKELDKTQAELECCGVYKSSDWFKTPWAAEKEVVPASCCRNVSSCSTRNLANETDIFYKGCYFKLMKGTFNVVATLISVVMAAAIVELIIMCIGFFYYVPKTEDKSEEIEDEDVADSETDEESSSEEKEDDEEPGEQPGTSQESQHADQASQSGSQQETHFAVPSEPEAHGQQSKL